MRTRLRSKVTLLLIVCAALLAVPGAAVVAQTSPGPTIQSDKADYAPGELVTLTGSGWVPGESVNVVVNDDVGQTWNRNVNVIADPSGNITDQFNLPNTFVAAYSVTATGSSGTVTTSFTDARVVTTATLNGGNSVNVQAGSSINANVSVTTDGSGANARWRSTGWRIATTPPNATSDVTCVDTPNHDGAGTNNESFSINAPNTAGTYNVYFIAFSDDACTWAPSGGAGQSNTFTLTNGVVATPTTRATTTTLARTTGTSPSTYGDSLTFTATVNSSAGSPTAGQGTVTFKDGTNAISGCSNVALNGSSQATCTTSDLNVAGSPHSITAEYSGVSSGSPQFQASTSNTLSQTVNKASSTTTVSCGAGPFTYDGTAKTPCTVSVTGAGGLNLSPAATYANNTGAGTATASYTYAGDANHNGSSDSKTFTIGKASSTTKVTCGAGPFTYDGTAKTPCSATVTGDGGLSQSLSVTYANNTGAGTADASASYAGDANHNGSNDTAHFTIDKASSTSTVTCPASVPYTGNPVTPCSATVTGAGGLNQSLTVSYTNNTDAGTATASATFAGDANHNGSSASKNFTITFNFTGFASPVDNNNVLNTAKAGQAIPLKWRLTDASGNPVTNLLSTDVKVSVVNYNCGLSTTLDAIEEYAAGSSGLQNLGNGY